MLHARSPFECSFVAADDFPLLLLLALLCVHVDGVLWVHAARAKIIHSSAGEREEKSIFES